MADAIRLEAEEWSLWRTFLAANARLTLRIDQQLQGDAGMTQGEYGTLAAIRDAPDKALRVGEIARQLGWEKSRASHLITRMHQRGLVERTPDTGDGRGSLIQATPAGRRRFLAAVSGHAAEIQASFLSHINPDERAVLRDILRRIADDATQLTPDNQ